MSEWVEITNRTGRQGSLRFTSVREAAETLLELQDTAYTARGMDYSEPIATSGGPTETELNDLLDLKRAFGLAQKLCDPVKFEMFVKVVFCNVPLRSFDGLSATAVQKKVRQCERVVESVLKELGMWRRG